MRIPFLAGREPGPDDDPERRKLLVPVGRVPRPFPGPWTLRALVRGDAAGAPAAAPGGDAPDAAPDQAPVEGDSPDA
jgi:hypothetical protein